MVNQGSKKPSSSKATREEKGKGVVVYEKKKRAASEVKNEDVEIGEIKAPKKKLTNDDYIDAFHKCEFVQSNWGCKDSLEKLGLLDDMMLLLKNVGLDMVLDMKHQIFPREVAQLMGSFELVLNKNLGCAIEDLGMVRFFVNGFGYKLSIKKLCEAYGFKKTCNTKHKANASKDGLVWAIIGKGDYHPGHIQAANIANPVIRYAHKLIASTIFAREEGDKVKEAEIALLVNGIKPFIEERLAKDGIVGYEDLNLGVMLAKRILYLKNSWILKPSESSKRVYIGGFLTPLLKACKVPLSFPSPKPCKIIDVNHLFKTHFLVGRKGEGYVYSFFDSNGDNQWVLLPNQEITSVTSWLNIRFKRGEKATFKEAFDPKPLARKPKKAFKVDEFSQGLPLGSSRYYHQGYQGRVQSEATRNVMDGLKKHQRFNKWSYKAFYNMKKGFKKEVKGLKDHISELKSIVETFVLGKKSPPRGEDGQCSYGVALEEARRHSMSHVPSQQSTNFVDPPRSSSYEATGSRRKRRHLPTPSPPSSDNQSFHLSDSYSES